MKRLCALILFSTNCFTIDCLFFKGITSQWLLNSRKVFETRTSQFSLFDDVAATLCENVPERFRCKPTAEPVLSSIKPEVLTKRCISNRPRQPAGDDDDDNGVSHHGSSFEVDRVRLNTHPEDNQKCIVPTHVGFIVDGNGRWAQEKGLTRLEGHRVGANVTVDVVRECFKSGVEYITLYLFSTENWKRPTVEIDNIMLLLEQYLLEFSQYLISNKIELHVIGQTSRLPLPLQLLIKNTGYQPVHTSATRDTDGCSAGIIDHKDKLAGDYSSMSINSGGSSSNKSNHDDDNNNNNDNDYDIKRKKKKKRRRRVLCLAISYGGREDITQSCREVALLVQKNELQPAAISEDSIAAYTYLGRLGIPDPDLIIRTSGEFRLSNFLLWHCAYTEFSSVDSYWPDFTGKQAVRLLSEFGARDRRYGGSTVLPSGKEK